MLAAATAAFGLSALLRKVAVDRLHPPYFQVVAATVYAVLITMMLSFLLLGERPSVTSAVGCGLVFAGVAIISLKS